MPLIATHPDSVEPLLSEGLEQISHLTGEPVDVDHVMAQLRAPGSPFIFVDESLTGFVILRTAQSFLVPSDDLYVLSAYKRGGNGMAEYDAEIAEIAQQIGADKVAFRTRRPALVRLSSRHGYSVDAQELTKEV